MSYYRRFQRYTAEKINLIKQSLFRQRRTTQLLQLKCSTDNNSTPLSRKAKLTTSEKEVTYLPAYDAHHQSFTSLNEVSLQHPGSVVSGAPVRMKGAQPVFLGEYMYLGGGYTGNGAMDTVVLRYHLSSNTWEQLPPSPLKWFGMTAYNNQLLLVGGREIACKSYKPTNKIAVWDEENKRWMFSFLSMMFARLSPIAYGYKDFLIVAGGEKGSLDYNFEFFDPISKRWKVGPSLPAKCMQQTSAIIGNSWFLLDKERNCILSADIRSILHSAINLQNELHSSMPSNPYWQRSGKSFVERHRNSVWAMVARPYGELVGMTVINDDLFLKVERYGNLLTYVQNSVTYWDPVMTACNHGDLQLQLLELVAESA